MANEIYDSTWWGNTIDTASSIGTSTEMIQGQFNLTKIGDELVTNGDFATDSNWNKNANWSISGGTANCDGTSNNDINQVLNLFTPIIGKTYKISIKINSISQGGIRVSLGGSVTNYYTAIGIYTYNLTTISTDRLRINLQNRAIGSVDNVSVKEVRATTVEASKCLADAIHRIGIQDIQN